MVAAQNHSGTPRDLTSKLTVVPVADDQWGIVAWLWQAYRHDLATVVNGLHPGPWTIAFQHDNTGGGDFWRRTADAAFGNSCWSEEQRPVPGKPAVPPDHWIETT